jgi:hypothetical protein
VCVYVRACAWFAYTVVLHLYVLVVVVAVYEHHVDSDVSTRVTALHILQI